MPELSFHGDSQEGVLFQIRLESSIEVSSHCAPRDDSNESFKEIK